MSVNASAAALEGLRAYRQAEREAYNAADLGMVENFAEDIILVSNGAPTLKGRAAVRDFFRTLWEHNTARFVEIVDEDVVEFGDSLAVSGRFVLEVTPKSGGAPVVDRGRFHGILIRDASGRYLLWREACVDACPTREDPRR
jgi:ketosteroid isomerase-like protein